MDNTVILITIGACILLSIFFSATETAFNALNRIRIKNKAENDGSKQAALVLRLIDKYDEMLSTILIGNNVVNIVCTSLATLLFVSLLQDEKLGATVASAVITVILLIFGEISPKSIAKENPERIAMLAAPPLNLLMILLTPVNWIFKLWQKALATVFKSSDDAGITEQELLTIVDEAEEDGSIDADESELIRSAIEFNELEVRDIFTPRIDVVAVSAAASMEQVAEVFAESGYSRLPVFEDSIDNIVGIINVKDFFNHASRCGESFTEHLKPVIFVPKSKKIADLRKELQEQQSHIAVVMDEFGCTVGIVTLEDILEELVGEIWDEHDEVVREILKTGEDLWVVSGKANVEKVFEELDVPCEFEAMTVSGWVMEILEKIPGEGDAFTRGELEVRVLKMLGKRIEQVEIRRVEAETEEEND